MGAPKEILDLVERFAEQYDSYRLPSYNETQLRREFVDPFFKALGWDIDNERGHAEAYKDVIHEDAIKIGGATKAPDYSFRIGGVRKFFVETKKPSVNIRKDISPAFQLRRYAWSAKLPLSILTDFEEFAVYDCRVRPEKNDKASKARTMYLTYKDYADRWDDIASIFSRDAILKGSFDKYAESAKRKRGTAEVDDAFLKEIEEWRHLLARNLALRNQDLSQRELNVAVQKTIDRIIFLRICEDRGIEQYGQLQSLLNGQKVYARLCELFRKADDRYNSGLFHFSLEKNRTEPPDEWTLSLKIDDRVLKEIIRKLYYPESPYEFSVLGADILGQVYEQFLGKVIRLTKGHQAKVEDKPEVKKAGGVYYTPTYIVDYIVEQTVGKLLEDKQPHEVAGRTKSTWKPSKRGRPLAVLDPACGSGSFLIGAYQYLLDWYRDWYVENGPKKFKDRIYQTRHDEWRLTTTERKRILLDHIYGVDIDSQAVEVTKLSLLLKVLEGENQETLQRQLRLFRERALPDLADNIKCGNSLIGPDFYEGKQLDLFDEDERLRINVFDWHAEFPQIMKTGGFDAVIGNPPYVRMEEFKELKDYLRSHYSCHAERTDLYIYFIEREHGLLKRRGAFGMIVSNKFIRAKYGQPLRRFLEENATVKTVVDLAGLPVFRGATVRTILLLSERIGGNGRRSVTYAPPPSVETLRAVESGIKSLDEVTRSASYRIPLTELTETAWRLVRPAHSKLLSDLKQRGEPLASYYGCRALFGLKTGLNDAFIIDDATRSSLVRSDKSSAELLRPILFGRDVKRYFINPAGRYVIYCHPAIDIHDYPAIESHLTTFRSRLVKRAGPQQWYELQQPAVGLLPIIHQPKIIYPIIASECRFVIDEGSFLINDKMFVLPMADAAVVGLLNSRLANFYFGSVCAALEGARDRYFEFRAQFINRFPIPLTMESASARLAPLADQMHRLHEQLAKVKTAHERTALERQIEATDREIDALVYELYGLSDEEIRIVEEATAR